MYKIPIYVRPIRWIAKFSEKSLTLKQLEILPNLLRISLSKIFWGYQFLVLALIILEGPIGFSDIGIARKSIYPLMPFWMIYFANYVLLYLPFGGTYALYKYLENIDIHQIHAFLISITTVIDIISVSFVLYKI